MINNKTDLRNKCIIIQKKLNRETFNKISRKLKKLGFDDKLIKFQDTQCKCSICIDKFCDLVWYIGSVDNTKNLTVKEFLK